MNHVEIAVEHSTRDDIGRRLAGQFYTPEWVCRLLAQSVLKAGIVPRTVGDPFCGDGRLVLHWLDEASNTAQSALEKLERVILWDYDTAAVTSARENVTAALKRAGIACRIESRVLDTFRTTKDRKGDFDVLLTNPPWDLLKPDSRDGITTKVADFKVALKHYARELSQLFPGASSERRKIMGGAQVNLARAGTLAAIDLLSEASLMGIVLPASIFADQASAPFRSEMFRRTNVLRMHYFPAEERAFTGVDQPFVVALCKGQGRTKSFSLLRGREAAETANIAADQTGVQPVPLVVTQAHVDLIRNIEHRHPLLRMLECDMRFGLWLGRELDETRIGETFSAVSGIPFLKGRQVDRFAIREHQPPRISPKARVIPETVKEHRFAWRDVSRPNQKRRIQAAIVPDGWVTGNSLGVGYFRYGDRRATHSLLAVLNSFVFELQLRAKLHTPHVSLGALRECCIPAPVLDDPELMSRLASLTEALIENPHRNLETRIEVEVAKAYGLSRGQFGDVLSAFPKLTDMERDELVSRELWA